MIWKSAEGGAAKRMKNNTLMTSGVIWKEILFFSIPLILGNLFQQLYNMVDSIVVGNVVGSDALAAVGSSGSIIQLLIGFCIGASAGARCCNISVLWSRQ